MRIVSRILAEPGRAWRCARVVARAVLTAHIPVPDAVRPFFGALYAGHVGLREGIAWGLRFFWYEPLFRSQCDAVGPGFRMERLPYMAGRGRITIGANVRLSGKSGIGFSARGAVEPTLNIGSGTFIGHDCSFNIARSVRIGRRCLIAGGVSIRDWDGHPVDAELRAAGAPVEAAAVRPVVIGDDVWIGSGARILKGVCIGNRAIVGAGAVVTRDVPAGCIVAGNPAEIVRSRAMDDVQERDAA